MSKPSRHVHAARQVWRLCAAAEWAYAAHGSSTTVKDILIAAGMSRRSYYEIFRSIEHMFARMTFAADELDRQSAVHFFDKVCPSADHMLCAMSLDATRGRDMSGTDFNTAFAARKKRVELGPEPVPADETFLLWYAQIVTSG